MNAKDIGELAARLLFNLIVRVIGLTFLYQGLTAIPNAIVSICPAFPHFYWRNLMPSILIVGWPLVIGYWLVRGAPWLMRAAYPDEPRPTSRPFGTSVETSRQQVP